MPRAKVVHIPQDIAPVDVTPAPVENAREIKAGDNTYKEVGTCGECGTIVYGFVDGNPHVNTLGNSQVVYAATGRREAPSTYCQKHDPNADHRRISVSTSDFVIGDQWQPKA